MVSGVSILNFSDLRKRFRLLRPKMGRHLLSGFGTRKSRLKKPSEAFLWSSFMAFLSIS